MTRALVIHKDPHPESDLHGKYMRSQPDLYREHPNKWALVLPAAISVWETHRDAMAEADRLTGPDGSFLIQKILPVVSLPSGEAKTVKRVEFRHGAVKEGSGGLEVHLEDVKYGNPAILRLLDEIRELHCKKARDYGADFENFRRGAKIGVPAWKSAWLRALDKISRIDLYCVQGELANEGVEDSLKDLAVLSLITLALLEESWESGKLEGAKGNG